MLDWAKLKPFHTDQKKSFEEFCYCIAKEKFKGAGKFTSIDDSGGGDGVEFYLTLPNGIEHGWQCKFFENTDRLSDGNRKTQIQDSLARAVKKHVNLVEWFLCTPSNFTPNEIEWFNNSLKTNTKNGLLNEIEKLKIKLQKESDETKQLKINNELEILEKSLIVLDQVELLHWNESEFNATLANPDFTGVRSYFFGELELNLNWFKEQVSSSIKTLEESGKYNSLLHTKTYSDNVLNNFLRIDYREQIDFQLSRLNSFERIFNNKYLSEQVKETELYSKVEETILSIQNIIKNILILKNFYDSNSFLSMAVFNELFEASTDDFAKINSNLEESEQLAESIDNLDKTDWERIEDFYYENLSNLNNTFKRFKELTLIEMHILGNAGHGKTHLTAELAKSRIINKLPAIFIPASLFTTNDAINVQIKNILGLSRIDWSEFLKALDTTAFLYKTRIPIIIDALNESTVNGRFSEVWNNLDNFINDINEKTKFVTVVTTCRDSYLRNIWESKDNKLLLRLTSFNQHDTEQIIKKYFDFYKIKGLITVRTVRQFSHPIYLKIFCEVKNPERKEIVEVNIAEQSLFNVFEEYFNLINTKICSKFDKPPSFKLLSRKLDSIANFLWDNSHRSLTIDKIVDLIDNRTIDDINFKYSESITKSIVDEGLIVYKDWKNEQEEIYFTYDLMAGYLIAKHIISKINDFEDLRQEEYFNKLFNTTHEQYHPLAEDITKCLAILLPLEAFKKGQKLFLHEIFDNYIARKHSIEYLVEIEPSLIDINDIGFIKSLFKSASEVKVLLEYAKYTYNDIDSIINMEFLSNVLNSIEISERDLSWSEYIRRNNEDIIEEIESYIKALIENESDISRIHLISLYALWNLTTTVRALRDISTKFLYYYGRRYFEHFLGLVDYSFNINDPYVVERTIGALYGICMFNKYDNNFLHNELVELSKKIYDYMFKPKAKYYTSHVLTRNSARNIIELAIKNNQALFNEEEISYITNPVLAQNVKEWGIKEEEERFPKRGCAPMQMDFANYTLGRLIENRRNYDFEGDEYKEVKGNMFDRIYELGFSLNKFGDIDDTIQSYNFRSGEGRAGFYHGKIDRYGKKYSWIAFYELAGHRLDMQLLTKNTECEFRDIDFSFPEDINEDTIIVEDFLQKNTNTKEWLDKEVENPTNYFYKKESGQEWILLNCEIHQRDRTEQKEYYTRALSYFIDTSENENVCNHYKDSQQNFDDWLAEFHYIYKDEIPESKHYHDNYINIKLEKIDTIVEQNTSPRFEIKIYDDLGEEQEDLTIKPPEFFTRDIYKEVEALYSSSYFCGSERSTTSLEYAYFVPCKKLTDFFKLRSKSQNFNFYDLNDAEAIINHCSNMHNGDYEDESFSSYSYKFQYIRKDLLDKFLAENKLALVYSIYSEKMLFLPEVSHEPDGHKIRELRTIMPYSIGN